MVLSKAAGILFVLVPLVAFAADKGKEREAVEVQVLSSQTKLHGGSNVFSYTSILFAQVNGDERIYECVQRGDICPIMESGKTYAAVKTGDVIHISVDAPEGEQPLVVKFKEVEGTRKSRTLRTGRSLP